MVEVEVVFVTVIVFVPTVVVTAGGKTETVPWLPVTPTVTVTPALFPIQNGMKGRTEQKLKRSKGLAIRGWLGKFSVIEASKSAKVGRLTAAAASISPGKA
jgi:hypothetical protein